MYQQISLDLLESSDPLVVGPLAKDERAYYYFFKRALDVTMAALALIILLPLMALIAVLIALDSPGPIIFVQKRVGAQRWTREGYSYWKQNTFDFYKFRSMVQDADPRVHQAIVKAWIEGRVEPSGAGNARFKPARDPRITRVGRLLRKASLDELPQLVNVLKGDMSIVGPRPDLPYSVEKYRPWHRERLRALPGMTGLWQVKGRGQVSFDDMVHWDVEYVRNQSLWLDLKIMFLTIPAALSGRGAA
jgi:lipopolysaccharide/colanic/teichoic acid biosynthesis glycosyltransferase